MQSTNEPNIVWAPIPGTSQELALSAPCHHIFYTGSRGPGKTDVQLMRFRRRVGLGYGPFWRGIIFDREYKHLDDLVSKAKRWFPKFNDGAEWLASTNSYKWVWPTGEELLFRVGWDYDDYDNYHGQEYPFIGWNEITKYPNSDLYDAMMSCNRSSFTVDKDAPRDRKTGKPFVDKDGKPVLGPIPLEVFSTGNSYGVGHGWVKDRFIDCGPYGQVMRKTINVFDPKTQDRMDVVKTQVTLFGSYRENIYLSPDYIAELESITDENKKASWLDGSWDVVAGGAFDDIWKRSVHVVPRFQVPMHWYIDRTFDWGSSHPFSVGWWCEATGEEVTLIDGSKWCPVKGSLIRVYEWYGSKKIGSNKGLKKSSGDIAIGIREIEAQLLVDEWILSKPFAGPADNQIRDVKEHDEDTIAKKMEDQGVVWERSDKSPGSRRNGLELARERMLASVKREGPALYFMECCTATVKILPTLPRDEKLMDDVDTESEDHIWDEIRYRVLKGNNRTATQIPVKWVN